ncbi:hypothetical protein J25TS5_26160 [Paenibacillus faecis]|uniref:ComEA family DNA-binding protein n=1 Tax=Paenibacillus faecis TaxID=862114 RepID=UPI001B0E1277|nr:helix-hairpin-helix domain-containing protein [Paenibacillus faecis]GIO85684.1 hypothetical protein J25TS5_26160 [Paenibacillus faecis]
MAKTYTNRGMSWEIVNSWWILLTLAPFGITSFVSFLYIGFRVKNQRWRLYGFGYLAWFITAFTVTAMGMDFGAYMAIVLWVVPVIHAFMVRPAFLIQLDVYIDGQGAREQERIAKLRQEAETRLNAGGGGSGMKRPPQPQIPARESWRDEADGQPAAPPLQDSTAAAGRIDVNTATEAELAGIPQIGIILAKKIVLKRQEIGGFESFDHFISVMGITRQPNHAIEPLVMFSQQQLKQAPPISGRKVDF